MKWHGTAKTRKMVSNDFGSGRALDEEYGEQRMENVRVSEKVIARGIEL